LPDEKSGFVIEEQFDTRSARSSALNDRDLFVLDGGNWKTGAPVCERLFDSGGKPEIRIDSGGI